MNRIIRTTIACVAGLMLAAAAGTALAADISGTWSASVNMSNGQSGSPTFVLKQSGSKLSGTYSGAFGTAPVSGSVSGSSVSFRFGTPPQQAHYVGKIGGGGGSMRGTVDYAGQAKGTFTASKQ